MAVNLVQNGTDTGLMCSLTSVNGAQVGCNDTAHTVTVAAGDMLGYKIVTGSTAVNVRIGIGTQCN